MPSRSRSITPVGCDSCLQEMDATLRALPSIPFLFQFEFSSASPLSFIQRFLNDERKPVREAAIEFQNTAMQFRWIHIRLCPRAFLRGNSCALCSFHFH